MIELNVTQIPAELRGWPQITTTHRPRRWAPNTFPMWQTALWYPRGADWCHLSPNLRAGVYVIECWVPGHYYVGAASDVLSRIQGHLDGFGSAFTIQNGAHRAVLALLCSPGDDTQGLEWEVTVALVNAIHVDQVGGVSVAGPGWPRGSCRRPRQLRRARPAIEAWARRIVRHDSD